MPDETQLADMHKMLLGRMQVLANSDDLAEICEEIPIDKARLEAVQSGEDVFTDDEVMMIDKKWPFLVAEQYMPSKYLNQ